MSGTQFSSPGPSPSSVKGHNDDRPIRSSGQYNLTGGYRGGAGEDEQAIMGDTINTMEVGTIRPGNNKDFKRKAQPNEKEFETMKTQEIYDQKLNEKLYDEFPEDFEEPNWTGEPDNMFDDDEPSCRLTQKKGQKEITDVLDEYKKFIKQPKDYQLANSSHFSELPSNLSVIQPSGSRKMSLA